MSETQSELQLPILVVDDETFSQNVLKASLENMGCGPVAVANDSCAALEILRSGADFQLILLDLHMPELDGIRFMRQLAQFRTDIDLVLVSGQRERVLETAISLGQSMGLNVLGAVGKPIEVKQLRELLNRRESTVQSKQIDQGSQLPLTREDMEEGIKGRQQKNRPYLLYQPIVSLATGNVVCVEVLIRWWNEERGVLTPTMFLPLARQIGLLDELTRAIYCETINQIADWFSGERKISAAINFSIDSFSDPQFTSFLISYAEQKKVDCARLIFEVAETQTSDVTPQCLEAMLTLRLKGFRLSIDDFGTGSSSLSHLKNIPFTELKIDRDFVTGALHKAGARSILEESINLARRLNIAIVAEGVESREDWDLVAEMGCDYVQGFYCGKPMNNDQLMIFLDHWQGPHARLPEQPSPGSGSVLPVAAG